MDQKKGFKNIWLSLLSITSIIFIVIGIVMSIEDHNYIGGGQFIFTSLIYFSALVIIIKNRIIPNYSNPMIGLGFVFSIIGLVDTTFLSLYIGIWILGVLLFIYGLLNKNIMKNRNSKKT